MCNFIKICIILFIISDTLIKTNIIIMAAIITNSETENCLRDILIKEGYSLSKMKTFGQTGTDIIATRNNEELHIEVIGYKKSPPARAKDFYEVFFRAVSRLNNKNCKSCIIALPDNFKLGLPQRVKQHEVAWQRIANAFPELEIWLVDTINNRYIKTYWKDWLSK